MKVCRTCCGCNPATTVFTITVYGCLGSPNVLPGATITVSKGGVTVASGTTDGSGVYTLGLLAPGSYTYAVSYPSLLASPLAPVPFFATCGNPVTTTASFAPIGTTNVCCCNSRDYPPTLHLTTSAGTCTLTQLSGAWRGSQTVSVLSYFSATNPCTCDGSAPASRPVSVAYIVGCTGSPSLFASWSAEDCPPGSFANYLPLGGSAGGCSFGGAFSVSFNLPWADACAVALPKTFTFPATDDTVGCPSPISGTAVLSL